MTINEPGLVARRQMALTHPPAADWPQWLRMWWGQIEPPSLLLRIGAFPTLTRLPSPSLFPSLALDVLGRMASFLTSSLPFLDPGGKGGPTATAPRLDYRIRRPRPAPARNTQLEFGAPSHADELPPSMDGAPQHAESQLETETQAHGSIDYAPAEAESSHFEIAPEASLTPFQHTDWEPSAHVSEHAPTLGESIHQVEEWREVWSAAELPHHLPQTFAILPRSIGSTLRTALGHDEPHLARSAEATVTHSDIASEFGHLLNAPRDIAGQMLSTLEGGPSLHVPPTLRLPASPAQHVRRMLPVSPRANDFARAEFPALSENAATLPALHLGDTTESGVHYEDRIPSPFALLGEVAHVPQLTTSDQNPILSDVLRRHDRAIESLSLVTQHPAEILPPYLPDFRTEGESVPHVPTVTAQAESVLPGPALMGVGESVGTSGRNLFSNLAPTFQSRLDPLQRFASLPDMALRTAHIVEDRMTELAGAFHLGTPIQHETYGSEALAHHGTAQPSKEAHVLPEHPVLSHVGPERAASDDEAQPSYQFRYTGQAPERMELHGLRYGSQPVFDLANRPGTIASTFSRLSIPALGHLTSTVAGIGLAELGPLPALGHRETPFELPRLASVAHLPLDVPGTHTSRAFATGSSQVAAQTVSEQFQTQTGQAHVGGPAGASLLAHEFARTDHPLALRPLPDITNLLVQGAEQVTHLPEHVIKLTDQVLHHNVEQNQQLAGPRMDLKREAYVTALAHGLTDSGGFMESNRSPYTGRLAVNPLEAAISHPAEALEAETPQSQGELASTEWRASESVAAAPAGSATNMDMLARQVFALLQSQLRAERDRHQIYDR